MKKLIPFVVTCTFLYTIANAQALPPDALIKCVATKDVKTFITTVRGIWLTPYGHQDWAPSKAVRGAYNNVTRENAPCELISGYEKMGKGRFLAVKNFEDKMIQIDMSKLDITDVEAARKYLTENGFTKGNSTSWETWESKEVTVELPNPWDKDYLKLSVYAKMK
jgi:hypothetical protein